MWHIFIYVAKVHVKKVHVNRHKVNINPPIVTLLKGDRE